MDYVFVSLVLVPVEDEGSGNVVKMGDTLPSEANFKKSVVVYLLEDPLVRTHLPKKV